MSKRILTLGLATLLMLGTLAEITPALARKGADDSFEIFDDRGRGRGQGQDDFFEDHRFRKGRRGKHHFRGEDRRRGRDRDFFFEDDFKGRGRGRGWDDR